MPALRAILFDLDDTLYPERAYVHSGLRAVADWAAARWPSPNTARPAVAPETATALLPTSHSDAIFQELVAFFESPDRSRVFDRWLAVHHPGKLHCVKKMVQVYRDHVPQIVLSPDVLQLLKRLREKYAIGVLSDGYLAVQQRKVTALGLASLVDTIVLSDRFGREYWKPHPRAYQQVLRELGHDPSAAVFVGDNPEKDFLGARRAGIRSIQVCSPGGVYEDRRPPTSEHAPDACITSLSQLPSLLD